MARQKSTWFTLEKYAVMQREGKRKRAVKAWQYYSIFDFCRDCGKARDEADRIAKWCRDKAQDGEDWREDGFVIHIENREVAI